jgi:hypothetical protein
VEGGRWAALAYVVGGACGDKVEEFLFLFYSNKMMQIWEPLSPPFDDTPSMVLLGYDDSFLIYKLLPTLFSLGGDADS